MRDVPVAMAPAGDAAVIAPRVVCPPPAAAPDGWRTVVDDTGAYELRLPPGFARAPAGRYVFIHGGEAWERGEATISIAFGQWGELSFGEEPGQRCRVSTDGASVFVVTGPRRVLAWYDRGSGSHEALVAVSSTSEAEVAALAPVVLSLRRRHPPG